MTTATATKTIDYTVSLGFCAEAWEDQEDSDGNINYDTQPSASRTIKVTLPVDAAPFSVFVEASNKLWNSDDDGNSTALTELQDEIIAQDGAGLCGDGIAIVVDGKEFTAPWEAVRPEHSWSDFSCWNIK